jgi:predicted glycogen debranching enzyme
MDARVHGTPVTPRTGKAVEINALWVNALAALAVIAGRVPGRLDPEPLLRRHQAARAAFARRFPAPTGWLYDVVDGPTGDDPALRPNQLLAYSLPYPALAPDHRVLTAVEAALLTPAGLRTLAPDEPGYAPLHRGDGPARDRAYHQGTVWPWLLGPYADACRRAGRSTGELTAGLVERLPSAGLGSVSETADGQPPHRPTGCPWQAWSVAEVLRVRTAAGRA